MLNDNLNHFLEKLSSAGTKFAGSSHGFGLALLIVIVWLISGPFLQFSNFWQLTINTGTTIVTFLMVFLIQREQNKDNQALHIKLNELLSAQIGASNYLLNIEERTEEELAELKALHDKLPKDRGSHSIDEIRDLSQDDEIHNLALIEGKTQSAA